SEERPRPLSAGELTERVRSAMRGEPGFDLREVLGLTVSGFGEALASGLRQRQRPRAIAAADGRCLPQGTRQGEARLCDHFDGRGLALLGLQRAFKVGHGVAGLTKLMHRLAEAEQRGAHFRMFWAQRLLV